MPNPNQLDPSQSRQQGICESNEQYAERMKRLDERDAMFRRLFQQAPDTSGAELQRRTNYVSGSVDDTGRFQPTRQEVR